MSDLATQNAWRDFKLAYAVLTSRSLSISWDEEPFALRHSAIQEVGGAALFYNLLGVLEAAIAIVIPAEELRPLTSLRERIDWLAAHGQATDPEELMKLAALHERLHFRELEIEYPEFAGVPEDQKPAYRANHAAMVTRGPGRPRFTYGNATRLLPPAVAAVEAQLLAWGLIEAAPAYRIEFRRRRHYVTGTRIEPLAAHHLGVETTITSGDGDDERTSFTAVPIDPDLTPAEWPAVLDRIEKVVAMREAYVKGGAADRVREVLNGDMKSAWIAGELAKTSASLGPEIAAMGQIAGSVEGEDHVRAVGFRARLMAVEAAIRDFRDALAKAETG